MSEILDLLLTEEDTTEIKQMGWFNRANNLLAELDQDPKPIYSSNLADDKMIGVMLLDGTIVNREGKVVGKIENEENYVDDVSILEEHPGYVKSPEGKNPSVMFPVAITERIKRHEGGYEPSTEDETSDIKAAILVMM